MSPTLVRFLHYARPYSLLIGGAVFFGLFKFTLALSLPSSVGFVVDHVFLAELSRAEQLQRLALILVVLAVAFLGRCPATYLRSYLAVIAGNRTIFDIRRDLFRHIQSLSMAYHARRRTGETISRLINDLNAAQGILNQGIISVCMDVIFLTGVVIFLFVWDWRLASVSLLTLPVYAIVFRSLNPRLREAAGEVQEAMQEMSGEVTEKLSALQVIISFVREKTEELNFFQRHRQYYAKTLRRVRIKLVLTTVAEFLSAVGPIVVISYGGYRVINGTLTPGELLLFNGFLAHLYLPTRRLADCSALLQEKLAAMDRVFEVFDTPLDIVDRPTARPASSMKGHTEFREVTFSYVPGRPILCGLSFTVEPGESVALVGRSGAGKSTMVNLVPRFYDVTKGEILVDGVDVRDFAIRSLRERIGIVHQEPVLFSGSIRENILYGRANATEHEMKTAAEMAHAAEFIEVLPEGYDTLVGERGVTLSGGQKQRLSIARAFLRDPRILILDEATSSLDSAAENQIQEALKELMNGRTTFVIAHRLSTVVDCDRVVVLDRGRIVQQGPHRELIRIRGPYRRFCKEQFGAIEIESLSKRAG